MTGDAGDGDGGDGDGGGDEDKARPRMLAMATVATAMVVAMRIGRPEHLNAFNSKILLVTNDLGVS